MCRCREEDELAGGDNARSGDGESDFHVVDRAEGHSMETAIGGHGFDAAGPDLRGEIKAANGFAKKASLFVLGFGEGDLNVRVQKCDGNARKTCPGAEVEKSWRFGIEMARSKQAFAEVPADDLFGVADRG